MKWINGRNIIAFSGSWAYLHDGKRKKIQQRQNAKGGKCLWPWKILFINTIRAPKSLLQR
jgi:hypothetical protein